MTLPPLPDPHDDWISEGMNWGLNDACSDPNQSEEWTLDDIARAYAAGAAAAVAAEREACAKLCDQTPPYPFRPSIEAAHAIRARSAV